MLVSELKELISSEVLTHQKIEEIKGIIEELKDKIDEGCSLADNNVARIKMRKSTYSESSEGSSDVSPAKTTLDFRKSGAVSRSSKRNFYDDKIK